MTFPVELQAQFILFLSQQRIRYHRGWTNYMQTIDNPSALVIDLNKEEELQGVLQAIQDLNRGRTPEDKITVRATAGWTDYHPGQCVNVSVCCLFPWNRVQENQYNEGFSFSEVVGGRVALNTPGTDVILRFTPKFHQMRVLGPLKNPDVFNLESPIHQLPCSLVEVSAGVQIAELSTFLRKKKLSLPTVSMISWVTAVGLAGTAGHGTGRDEPAFSGLIESIKVCDMDGVIREINRDHPDFIVLRGGHSGLLGIVLSIQLRVVQAFNLRETITLFTDTKEMTGQLGELLANNQYISIMGMPSFGCPEIKRAVSKWQIRQWNFTQEKPSGLAPPTYAPDIASFAQELEARLGADVLDYLVDPQLKHLLPAFLLFSAAVVSAARGVKPQVNYENHITHPQVAFPRSMRDVSYLIPVSDAQAGPLLEVILQHIEGLLKAAANQGEYPVTYAIYVRYFKGTNGGLSTSATNSDDERILAMDVVTHPDALGISHFEDNLMGFFQRMGITPRNHLGKNFPSGVSRYEQFLTSDAITQYKLALSRWHQSPGHDDGEVRLAMSPFNTPYLQAMLSSAPILSHESILDINRLEPVLPQHPIQHLPVECQEFLTRLLAEIRAFPVIAEAGIAAKAAFIEACINELSSINKVSSLLAN